MSDEFANEYLPEKSIAELQADLLTGKVTSKQLVEGYLRRIEMLDRDGPKLRAIIELNPDAGKIASKSDADRRVGRLRGPLHGIPIVLKDNIDTGDKMLTTAGSLAMVTSRPAEDATLVFRLRMSGAVILGKTNMSEWANFRSAHSSSGWSGRGGQARNPYVLTHGPSGSSSGSAVAASASLAAAAIGTETDGSIVSPANACGIVGLKPTVGLVSRAGVIPISASQDTIGPMARTVTDAALLLGTLTGVDPKDGATAASRGKLWHDYTRYLKADGLKGARIGVLRKVYTGYHAQTDALFEAAVTGMRAAGAVIVDPADLATAEEMRDSEGELQVLMYEFKRDLEAYLAKRLPISGKSERDVPRTLDDLIQFNLDHEKEELTVFGQDMLERCERLKLTEAEYREILATNRRLAGREGIDAVLQEHRLDAIVAPTSSPAGKQGPGDLDKFLGGSSSPAAMVGYPIVTVPMGFVGELPVGISFIGAAWSEPTLLRLAFAYEQRTLWRRAPKYLAT